MYLIPVLASADHRPGRQHNEKQARAVGHAGANPAAHVAKPSVRQLASILVTRRAPGLHASGVNAPQKARGLRAPEPAAMRNAAPLGLAFAGRLVSALGQRGPGKPTLAGLREQEILTHPFLPSRQAPVAAAVCRLGGMRPDVDTHAFAALRP